jgi:hypothetical protein
MQMQKATDDLSKSLTCVTEASKQVEMAILHMRPSLTDEQLSKDEIAIRQRVSGFLYAILGSLNVSNRVMSVELANLLALVPDPEPGPDGKISVM